MKKLQKISINPEKVIKNDELVNLRGGYGGTCAMYCELPDAWPKCGYDYATIQNMVSDCSSAGGVAHWCCDSCESSSWYEDMCSGNWPYS